MTQSQRCLASANRSDLRARNHGGRITTLQLVMVVPRLENLTIGGGARLDDYVRERVKNEKLKDRHGKHYRCNECSVPAK